MPTPFMHLRMAEQIRSAAVERYGENGRLPILLAQSWPAFYLGSVAADCQDLAGIPRTATHFYKIPPDPDNQAYPRMLAQYPELADAARLTPDQAIFVAGYCVHLMADLIWLRDILLPFFMNNPDWRQGFAERHLVHNIVLTYLDKMSYEALPETAVATLAAANPVNWLPFIPDDILRRWRDRLVAQLQPEGELETVSVYARRLKMPPEQFAAGLQDSGWMTEHVFNVVPVPKIQSRLDAIAGHSLEFLICYLNLSDRPVM